MSLTTGSPGHLPERALLILVELEHGPLPAAMLKRKIEQAHALSIEPGAFYKTLTSLERKGWIELADTGALLHPHSYGLTERGQAALHQYRALASQRRERIPTTDRETSLRGGIMKLVTWIVKLYPRKWRERYEIEMLALLEEHQITFLTVFDLLFGVVDARLDPHYRTERDLLAFKNPRVATLAFFAMLAVFLFLVQGSEFVIIQGAITLLSLGQPTVPNQFTNVTLANNVLTILALMMVPIYGSLYLTTMFVAFASMKRIIAGRHVGKALFAAVCFVIPFVIVLLLNTSAPTFYGTAYFTVIRGNGPFALFALWVGLESLMGILLLTILKSKQAIATRRKGMLFLIILIDSLLVFYIGGFLLSWLIPPRFSFLGPMFTSLAMALFPFTTIGVLPLVLVGSKLGEWTKRFALVTAGLAAPIMLVILLLFLIGSWSPWMQVSIWAVGFVGIGLLLCTLLALAAFRSLLLALKRTPITKAAMQELSPLEMRQ
jgi:DNA-binding PadR family transcriptional regulator